MNPIFYPFRPIVALVLAVLLMPGSLSAAGTRISFDKMSTDAQVIHGVGGTTKVKIKAKGKWTLTSDSEWLTVSPASGKSGRHTITVTTAANTTGKPRTGVISLSPDAGSESLSICQRPFIYERKQAFSGKVYNAVGLTYDGTGLTDVYSVMPYPKPNLYQDVYDIDVHGAAVLDCPDGENSYISYHCVESNIPPSGSYCILESFNVVTYDVTAHLDLITDIPPYDPKSPECKYFLRKENNDLVDQTNETIMSLAETFWVESKADLIDYARRCYEWAARFLEIDGRGGIDPIKEILNSKKSRGGNHCSLFVSLMRARGIPARHVFKLSPQRNNVGHITAEFYLPAYGWIPVDPYLKSSNPRGDYFGVSSGNYVVMSFGVNPIIKNAQSGSQTISYLFTYNAWHKSQGELSNLRYSHYFQEF